MLGTRPDLAYAVGLLARFSSNPSNDHLARLFRLLGYIKKTRKRYLYYGNTTPEEEPEGYTDSDHAGDAVDYKSTSGYVFYVHGGAFSWRSRLQDTTANSTMEAEYIALYHASLNAVWIRNFFEQLKLPLSRPLLIHCDNQPAIDVLKGTEAHKKAKHFQVKVHVVREHYNRRYIDVEYCQTEENDADIFTKAMPKAAFVGSVSNLGLSDIPATPDPDETITTQYDTADDS